MSNDKTILIIEKMLADTIIEKEKELDSSDIVYVAKTKGIIAGAEMGLSSLREFKRGTPSSFVLTTFNSKVSQSIYSLISAEEKCLVKMDNRARCEIAYYDSLSTTLQLLREEFIRIVANDLVNNGR